MTDNGIGNRLREQSPSERDGTIVPEPVDEESFRAALELVLDAARANRLAFANRSWECQSGLADSAWDVEIVSVER